MCLWMIYQHINVAKALGIYVFDLFINIIVLLQLWAYLCLWTVHHTYHLHHICVNALGICVCLTVYAHLTHTWSTRAYLAHKHVLDGNRKSGDTSSTGRLKAELFFKSPFQTLVSVIDIQQLLDTRLTRQDITGAVWKHCCSAKRVFVDIALAADVRLGWEFN